MLSLPKNIIKRWYFILSAIWIVGWFLIIFILVPDNPVEEIKLLLSYGTEVSTFAFQLYWLIITAPILLYLLILGLSKLWKYIVAKFIPNE